ncbi:tail sheath [Bacillus phage Troll]|uniref:Tail sheath protein n=7 Tax=Caudoviricetes TaxID=2731619 RepID=A0A7U3T8M5_9CAUD|nr:tail sheath [Bacillus phage Troll]YP_009055843.1 tail sheath [Bacillus phage Riley]YP_009206437.1 tail sheath [Bacillus phage AvesoBmore]AMW61459.1 tail sheath protein [Bacillus phage Juglone]ASZ75812.1 tail sheath protein [Bacillus phage Taffo16]QDH49772.1 tail sheath protein [Bacillus phage Beyonphe]QPY77316.1 tail sheath protein [Bacillus phage Anthos]ULF48700.1 tail sheath protein [Bacillus phage BillyBob]
MAISYGFNRKRPRTEVFLDSTALGSANAQSEKPVIILGSATDGKPLEPVELTNLAQARSAFQSGELVDAIEMAWNPAAGVGGAGKIYAVRVDEAKQASLVSSGLTFTSNVYGADANNIQVQLMDNAITGAKRVGVYFTKVGYEKVYDNIGNIFNITYTGAQKGNIEVKVNATTKLAEKLILKVGADTQSMTEVRTYELGVGVYEDVNALVNDIANLPDFKASMNSLGGYKDVRTQYLDVLAAKDMTKDAPLAVKAIAADIANTLANDRYVSVAVDFTKTVPATIPVTSLSGGETKAPKTSWAETFLKVADLGGYYIVPLTASESVHAELSHFLRTESTSGNQLRGFVGGGLEETFESLKARQSNLRNARVAVVGDDVVRRMADGRVYKAPGYMYAAQVAGLASGLAVGEPITYKKMNIESLGKKYIGEQLDQLDAAGVVMTEFARNTKGSTFRIVSDPTSYNRIDEPVQNRISLGEVSDFLTTELRTVLDEEFIGTRLRNTSASIIKNRIESFLDVQKNVDGLIVNYSPEDIQVVINGNTAIINIAVQPTQGLDYINVYLSYKDNQMSA